MKHRGTLAGRARWLLLLCMALLTAGCGISAVPREGSSPVAALPSRPVATEGALPASAPAAQTQGRFFVVDKVVRSTQLDGIDLHLRYAERGPDGLTLHLSFYNNRGEDLAFVTGASVADAQLIGDATYAESSHSASFDTGIGPEGSWLSGGAGVGTLTFPGVQGSSFRLVVPGFPELAFGLDEPVAAAPDPAPPAIGVYDYDVEVTSPRLENISLRVEQARVESDALLLTISFTNRNPSDITFSSTITGHDAVLFDGLWQQYRPGQVEQTLDQGIQPVGDVWGEDEANTGTLTFPRPTAGDTVLLRVPSYPLVRLQLRPGGTAEVASDADLPPSVEPRPTPTPAPTPTPLTGDDLARQQASELVAALDAALTARDRDAYVALFAPELQAAQGELFDRIGTLPLDELHLSATDEAASALPNGSDELRGVLVELSYKVRDAEPLFSAPLEYTLARSGADAAWQIAEIGGQLPFWAYGPTVATRSGAFWIFYRPELAEDVAEIEGEARAALDRVDQALPGRAAAVNVMNITATEEEFQTLTQRSGSRFLGVASARYQINKRGIVITSQSFFINGAAFKSDPAQDRQRTIAHELTHLVLSPRTMPYTPAWVSEGAAMFVTADFEQSTLAEWYAGGGADELSLLDLTGKTSFGGEDHAGDQTTIDYGYSAFLAKYLVETYGQDAFFSFYEAFADVPFETIRAQLPLDGGGDVFDASMGEIAQQVTPEKVQAAFGVELETLEQDYERWLGTQLDS